MALNEYIQSGGKYLRCGYTTGTCAALAAAAAARLLVTGKAPDKVSLLTPRGIRVEVTPDVCECLSLRCARAAVLKDGGDDKDVTDGILICATVSAECKVCDLSASGSSSLEIHIDGGTGVGRVTKPGLDQPVGNAAINRVPREMIEAAVLDIFETAGMTGRVDVIVSVPEGERIAKKTFNGHLGIEGGISILGTSGIVEPMSMQAFIDSVCLEIRQVRHTDDNGRLILTPGNYGMDFLKQIQSSSESEGLRIPQVPIVTCSNFIGDALDAAAAEKFREVLLVGHIGKLVKVAGGVMNTHSRYADCRTELFTAHAALCGADRDVCRKLMDCVTTDACLDVLKENGICDCVMDSILESVDRYLLRRVGDAYRVGAVTFSNVHGFLGCTRGGKEILTVWEGAV